MLFNVQLLFIKNNKQNDEIFLLRNISSQASKPLANFLKF